MTANRYRVYCWSDGKDLELGSGMYKTKNTLKPSELYFSLMVKCISYEFDINSNNKNRKKLLRPAYAFCFVWNIDTLLQFS